MNIMLLNYFTPGSEEQSWAWAKDLESEHIPVLLDWKDSQTHKYNQLAATL